MPEKDNSPTGNEMEESIKAAVASGQYQGLTVDIESSVVYTFRDPQGDVVGTSSYDGGSYTGLTYPAFAVVQNAQLAGLKLAMNMLNDLTQATAKAIVLGS